MKNGGFTLPGEAGFEQLTLKMAEKWGADAIRDSDGTTLSPEIVDAGYDIYSTICIIRGHNEWLRKNPECRQQCFLMSEPVVATGTCVTVELLSGYCADQFCVNDSVSGMKYWQIFDRTTGKEIPFGQAAYDKKNGTVTITGISAFHSYTVNFLTYRIWEEISMYNYITNDWKSEHLVPLDPRTDKARDYLSKWLDDWCVSHPSTSIVRFTSLFYNFVWIWGSDERHKNYFTDWGSYDFTVSEKALYDFGREYGYTLTSEDFINNGKLHSNNLPPTEKLKDYIQFTNRFVVDYGSRLVDIVHGYGKKAYMFYDDSWIGTEPYSGLFDKFGFDAIIKCVFNGYEVRQCANVDVPVHELRLHPYLFPTGLNGTPTFMEGGDPVTPAKEYWASVRRALLRQPVDRIGLGGYLHLTQDFPDFCDYIEKLADEFRMIKTLHANGGPNTLPITVAVLTAWGKLRTWSLSGNYSETCMHDLLHVIEALSGLPVNVSFIDFDDVRDGKLKGVDVLINAGLAGLAWTGGDEWNDPEVTAAINRWTYEGGAVLAINEPSAVAGHQYCFQLAEILGIDLDDGSYMNHGRWSFDTDKEKDYEELVPEGTYIEPKDGLCLICADTKVLMAEGKDPLIAVHSFGAGKGVYLSSFRGSNANNRLLLNLLLYAKGISLHQDYLTDNCETECAYYPHDHVLAVINNSPESQETTVQTPEGRINISVDGYDIKVVSIDENKDDI